MRKKLEQYHLFKLANSASAHGLEQCSERHQRFYQAGINYYEGINGYPQNRMLAEKHFLLALLEQDLFNNLKKNLAIELPQATLVAKYARKICLENFTGQKVSFYMAEKTLAQDPIRIDGVKQQLAAINHSLEFIPGLTCLI